MATAEQVRFFQTFGYLVMRRAFSPTEMATLIAEFVTGLAEDRQGHEFGGDSRQTVYALVERRLPWLIEDDRIFVTVERLLGPRFTWIGSDSNLYVGDTSWHVDNDRLDLPYETLKVALYLDSVGAESGCLRVIAGSHHAKLHEDFRALRQGCDPDSTPFGVPQSEIPSISLESEPGDVVLFNHRIYHASFGGAAGRRMFTMNFGAEPTTEAAKEHLRSLYAWNVANQRQILGTDEVSVYAEEFLASDRPRLHQLARPLVDMGMK